MADSYLTPPEWLAVSLFIIITGSLAGLAYFTQTPDLPTSLEDPVYATPQEVTIRVSGAVKEPGTYRVPKGSSVRDLLEKIATTDEADTDRLDLDKPLRRGQALKVPVKKKKRKKGKRSQ